MKKKKSQVTDRPTLDPGRIYGRREAALACGISQITLIRAYEGGHLSAFHAGRRRLHSGAHLLAWLEAGGRTSPTAKTQKTKAQAEAYPTKDAASTCAQM